MRDLSTLPKAHLHVHLEGAVRRSTLAHLAAIDGTPAPDARDRFGGLADFFARKDLIRRCLRRPEDFRRVAVEFCADEAAAGTRYAEVSFTAAAHGERLGDLDMPLASVPEGLAEGTARYGVHTRVILDHSRRRPVERAWHTLRLAQRYAADGVVGIGVAGDESYPLEPFSEVFRAARRTGLHVVHHAGEAGLAEHPLPRLRDAGLVVTLNTDDPAMLGTTLATECARVRDTFGYPDTMLAGLARAGAEASFAPGEILAGIDRWLNPEESVR